MKFFININIKMALFLLSIFIVINVLTYFLTQNSLQKRVDIVLKENISNLTTHYNILFETQKNISYAIHKSILKNTDAVELLENSYGASDAVQEKNRAILYSQLAQDYEIFKKIGVLQIQFVFKDNIIFLRVQKPSKFGDDISKIRADYRYVNENKKPIRTFAQGRTSHGFRNTFPVFNKNGEHIGAMEVSFSSEEFHWYLDNVSNIHSHFIVNKDVFESTVLAEKDLILRYNKSAENSKFMITLNDNHHEKECIIENRVKLAPIRREIDSKMVLYKPFNAYVEYQNKIVVVSFLPIENIENKNLAWIVSYKDSPIIKSSMDNTFIIRVITLFLSIIIIYFLLKILSSKQKIEHQHKLLNDIINSTDNIIFITDFKEIKFSNHKFNSIFDPKYNIFDMCISSEGFLHKGLLGKNENFESLIERTPAEDRVVSVLDKNLKSKVFSISITKSENDGDYIVSLTDITKIKEYIIATEQKVYLDELTKVYNRYKFNQVLEEEFKLTNRYHNPFSIAILDIDKFKDFNDKFGHLIGDEVLVMMAQTIRKHVRETDVFARWGGEEFVVLFRNTSLDEAKNIAEILRNQIKDNVHPTAGVITASFGVTQHRLGDVRATIFKRCDDALYIAKGNGRDRVEVL